MFDLGWPLVETVEIDGVEYNIDLSFDNVLRLIDMLNDKELDDITQIQTGLEMLLGVCFICDIRQQEKILHEIFKSTIAKGKEDEKPVDIAGNPMPEKPQEKIYSLKQDAEYIYASFYQDYGIDLFEMQGKLHWYKFQALLSGLRNDTKFKEVLEIRTMDLPTGKGTAKQKKRIKELKEYYRLKDDDPETI